jgi:hypothetical protein
MENLRKSAQILRYKMFSISNTTIFYVEARLSVTCGVKDAKKQQYFETYYNVERMD